MSVDAPQVTIFEAEAAGVLSRAESHSRALGASLDEAATVLQRAGADRHVRTLEKLRELERVVATRISLLAKRVLEGEPE